jgi:hypothetical protein
LPTGQISQLSFSRRAPDTSSAPEITHVTVKTQY